jgi:undecaprenyl-diphosphatase
MEYLKALDLELFHFLNAGFTNRAFDFLAVLPEKGLFAAIVLGSLALIFGRNARYRLPGLVLIGGYLLGGACLETLKEIAPRLRPCVALPDARVLIVKATLSFPSGHALGAFMAAAYLSAVFGKKAGAWLFAAAALVGLSRIYCGVHYPSDVFAGAVLGSVSGCLLALVEKKIAFLFPAVQKNAKA